MAISYTWSTSGVETYPTASDDNDVVKNDVVFKASWTVQASTGSSAASVAGVQSFNTQDFSSFVEFEDLDNDIVTGWVTSSLEAELTGSVNTQEGLASASLAAMIAPVSEHKTLG